MSERGDAASPGHWETSGRVRRGDQRVERLDAHAAAYTPGGPLDDLDVEGASHRGSMQWVVRALGGARKVLEMGYGPGWTTPELLDAGLVVDVVEGSATSCERARQNLGRRVRVHESMFEDFVPEVRYDAVLAQHVLEHVNDPVALLRRAASWIKPGGRLVVIVPNSQSLHRRLAVRMALQPALDSLSPRDHELGHQRVYDLDGLVEAASSAGLVVVDRFGYFLKTVSNGQMEGWTPDLLQALCDISGELDPRILANVGIVATLG